MTWHYISPAHYDPFEWLNWLDVTVGAGNWKWGDVGGGWCICFAKEEDAIAFKLRFKV